MDRPGIDRQLRGSVSGDPPAAIEAQREKLTVNEIREEILPLQRLSFATINITTGNRMPDRVVVGIDGGDERTGIIDGISPRICDRPFNSIPAVVGTPLAEINLFPFILSDIGDVKISQRAVEARSPTIAQPERKYFISSVCPHERIVHGHVIVVRGIGREVVAVHVDAQNLAEQAVDVLAGVQRIATTAAVTDGYVEISVGAEAEPPALVVAERRLVDREDGRGARRIGDIGARRIDVVAANVRVAVGCSR